MAASFFRTADGQTYVIGNFMSILNAGFKPARSYYNKSGDQLTYYTHESGCILEVISRSRRQSIKNFYHSKEDANNHFKLMQNGKTYETGKWIPEKRR